MKPNKFFSLKRFSRFLCTDLLLNKKNYLFFFTGITVGIYLILLQDMHTWWDGKDSEFYKTGFVIGLLGLGAFIGDAFNDLNSKTKTANYLLLPASIFEKILSQFLIRFVFGSCLFLLLFRVDAYLARATVMHEELVKYDIVPFHYSMLSEWVGDGFMLFSVMLTVSIETFLFAVRLFFRRFALVKTLITGFVLFFLGVCCFPLFSHLFYPAETQGFDVKLPIYIVFGDNIENIKLFVYCIAFFAWLFLLPLAYFKLKEKQV
jgi:hypothetical protein